MTFPDAFLDLAGRVNNWGRWGPADETGTLNLITDEVVRRGVASVQTGRRISLTVPLTEDGIAPTQIGRKNPVRTMLSVNQPLGRNPDGVRFSDDEVSMPLQCATHWDALAHVSQGGRLYNGHPADSVTEAGAERCGIDKAGTLITRGILLDVARAKELPRLAPGYPITPEDLDAAERIGGVPVESGDAILIRTGHMQLVHEGRIKDYSTGDSPGPGMACAAWFRDRDVSAVATDTIAFEVWPLEDRSVILPLHILDLIEMGLTQGQNFDLEALAADCAADWQYAFLLDASPLPFVRGLGSPVHPVAVK